MKEQERAKFTFSEVSAPQKAETEKTAKHSRLMWLTHIQTHAVKSQLTPRQPVFPKLVKV